MRTSAHEPLRQLAQKYADWASKELSLEPISVDLGREDGDAAFAGLGQLIVFRPTYLAACTPRLLAFSVFHEVGHLYATSKQEAGILNTSAHDEEYVADYVGGWLLGKWGIPIHEHPLIESDIRTVTDGVGTFNTPVSSFPTDLMLHLGLNETASHPGGGPRVTRFVVSGWSDAVAGNPLQF